MQLGPETLEARTLLAGDLIAHWVADSLATDEGATVEGWADSVAGINAVATGTPTVSPSTFGGRAMVRFDATDGTDLFVVDNTDSPLANANDFTFAVVFATTAANAQPTSGQWYDPKNVGLVDSSSQGFATDWGLSLTSDGKLATGLGGGFANLTGARTIRSTAQGLNDGQPHTAIVSRSGGTLSLYVDNGPATTVTDASAVARTNTVDLVFGGLQTFGGRIPFHGDMAEVRFYNGSVNAAEATALYNDIQAFYANEPAVANDDTYTTTEDVFPFLIVTKANGVLANDTDAESDPLTATVVEDVQHGELKLEADGSFVYSPVKDFFGTDSFTYSANDFRPGGTATVTIEVAPAYDAATALADLYKSVPPTVLAVDAAAGVFANDRNPDAVALSAILESDVAQGTLTLNRNGSFRYDPGLFAGTTSFSYRVDDGTRRSSPATVTLNINTPPTANNDAIAATEDVQLRIGAANGLLANDRDADGDSISAELVDAPRHGSLTLNADGSLDYLAELDYSGPDSFTYRLTDWLDASATATVNLTVAAVDDAPIGRSDLYFGATGTPIAATIANGVLANDSDVDSPRLSAQLVSGPSNGGVQLNADGSFRYTPNALFQGEDRFTYRVSDTNSVSEAVSVRLFVGTTPVTINEILTASRSSLMTRTRASVDDTFQGDAQNEDWIELQNKASTDFDLGGFHLTDDQNSPLKWQFPAGTVLPASGQLVVFASRLNVTDPALDELGLLHTNFTLKVEGEYLAITAPNGAVLDEMDPYPLQVPSVSYGTTADGSAGYFITPTPGAANGATYDGVAASPTFSVPRGFYSAAVRVALTSATAGAEIRYTTDGSEPTATTGIVYSAPIDVTTTTNLRAATFKQGFHPSRVGTHTYVFLSDVVNQGNTPAGYPDMFGVGINNNGVWAPRPADYEMDSEITQSDRYKDLMDDALLAVPSISITTSIANLFDTQTGIYQNTDQHGVDWERPASIEMIMPDGTTAFQIDAGLRIQGGASREPWKNPKHGFRLKFKGIYGSDDLAYDWFGGDSVDQFDEIVLRAGANQAWTHHNNFLGDNRGRAQYIRDQWAADTYRAMGNLAPHTDYAHVYVNGMYWGLYNPKERPTGDFMASYLGGNGDDYDVLNAGELLSGTNDAWRELNDRRFRDLEDPALYEEFTELLDVDSFMDYMIMNHYGANQDWDSHNWYAARRREPGNKFYFIPWDEEFLFIGENDNQIASREAAPGTLFRYLQTNPEFKVMFADRIQELLFNDGLLTPDSVVERWEARSSQITDAIIGESARWGDFRRDVDRQGIAGPFELLERDVQWMAERERLLNDYFPVRTGIVVQQYRNAELFPTTEAPVFSVRGGRIASNDAIELASPVGKTYYTLDGSDPRLPGGEINPNALEYSAAFTLNQPAQVSARVLNEGEWSAIDRAFFRVDTQPASATNLRISEINYNPASPTAAEAASGFGNDDFEFIELANISPQRIDLTGVRFVQQTVDGSTVGVNFTFAPATLLEPGARLVVVEDTAAFANRYGQNINVAGQWVGRLSNSSELLTLMNGDVRIQQFAYSDGWYPTTDGGGPTLEVVDATAELDQWAVKEGWRAGSGMGSPGRSSLLIGDSNGDGIFNSADLVAVFTAGEYEDAIAGNSTFAEGDWNGDGDFTTSDLVLAFQSSTYTEAALAYRELTQRVIESADAKLKQDRSLLFIKATDKIHAELEGYGARTEHIYSIRSRAFCSHALEKTQ